MRTLSVLRKSTVVLAQGALVALLVVGLMASTVLAARGGNGNGGGKPGAGATLALVMVSDQNANGAPNYGDVVKFTATTSARNPEVGLRCMQGATFVFDGYVSLYDSWLSKNLTLESSRWDQSRDASCTARLFYYDNRSREQILTTLAFVAAP